MTVSDERTPLLSHVVLVAPGESAAVVPEDLVAAAALPADPWKGLSNRELAALARDPFWVRLRTLAFWSFWMCWLGLLAAALGVVVSSPRCPDVACGNSTLANSTEPPATTTEDLAAWTTLTLPS